MKWWTAILEQVDLAPFAREEDIEREWYDLPNGGKDGLYLVVLSLGWWINARDRTKSSKVDEVIEDVAWVIDALIEFLSAEATTNFSTSDQDSGCSSPACSNSDHPNDSNDSGMDDEDSRPSDSELDSSSVVRVSPVPLQKRSLPIKLGPPRRRSKRSRT